ncbi:hypothetical protein CCH79_00001371 [Gambusia affinis]|uniref:RRM domain-containing protein n=1 Tax=Gambusia affinis TaxID=33528 RepID=A0A315VTS7_GAMAF|nr:hypothetical protein CCH79_00001371 [Gambusia affinis]
MTLYTQRNLQRSSSFCPKSQTKITPSHLKLIANNSNECVVWMMGGSLSDSSIMTTDSHLYFKGIDGWPDKTESETLNGTFQMNTAQMSGPLRLLPYMAASSSCHKLIHSPKRMPHPPLLDYKRQIIPQNNKKKQEKKNSQLLRKRILNPNSSWTVKSYRRETETCIAAQLERRTAEQYESLQTIHQQRYLLIHVSTMSERRDNLLLPLGYAFLLFQEEASVQALIDACIEEDGKLYLCVSSPTIKDKPVQIRPWNLSDSDFVMDGSQPLDPRKTIFVGGVPRPLRAVELAMIMDRLYGGVCYAGIDTDPELKYPKGAGRVAFSNQQSYIAAISARFVQLQHNDIDKRAHRPIETETDWVSARRAVQPGFVELLTTSLRLSLQVEVKPYVLDDQMCDECQGARCGGKFAPFFCANVTCLQYYCEFCWASIHSRAGREFHKPLVKEGGDRPRHVSFRWS